MKFWQNRLNLPLGLFLICSLLIRRCDSAASLIPGQTTYSQYIGDSVTFTCNGLQMNENDVIWQYVDAAGNSVLIFNELSLTITDGKYAVSTTQYAFSNISTSLTINNVGVVDAQYTYECVCNVYRTCAAGNTASASMALVALGKLVEIFVLKNINRAIM